MKKIRLGKSGLMVSEVGFGGIPIQRLSEAGAVAVVQHCLDRGVNYIDTARVYGPSEERIGKAIRGRRDQVILASKSTARDRAGLLADLETSLKTLGVEAIDLFQLHNVATEEDYDRVMAPDGALEGARDAQQAGKIRHIGVTSHSLEMAKAEVRSGHFETVMFPMNFVAREPGEELYPLAVQHDVGFVVMKPFGGGMLEDARLAFKYLAQFPHAVAIPGIEKAAEMDQILEILSQPRDLSASERAEMERIRTQLGNRFCRRCEYCQPCPQDVPVPMLMTAASALKRMPMPHFLNFMGAAVQKAAEQCEKCGECMERCPYGLPILEMMDESISLYRHAEAQYQASSTK